MIGTSGMAARRPQWQPSSVRFLPAWLSPIYPVFIRPLNRTLGSVAVVLGLVGCGPGPADGQGTPDDSAAGVGGAPANCGALKLCGSECVDVTTSASHCGSCDHSCPMGQLCQAGQCQPQCNGTAGTGNCICASGLKPCNQECVDPLSNAHNCGACGVECAPSQSCNAGHCECPLNTTLCGDACVDTNTDPAHCGDCLTACGTGQTCQGGECSCQAPNLVCDGACVEVSEDPLHCGNCETICSEIESCTEGRCRDLRPDGDACGGAPSGVTLSHVTANQGVEIELGDETGVLSAGSRNGPIIAGRKLLLRAFTETSPTFQTQSLSARLYLKNATGTTVLLSKRTMTGPSTDGALASTFNFSLTPEQVTADLEYHVEIVACDAPAPAPAPIPRLPTAGEATLGAVPGNNLTVHFVPITHGNFQPDTSDENLAQYTKLMMDMYPIATLTTDVIDPMASGQNANGELDFEALLQTLQQRRQADAPPKNVYYYGLVRPAQTFNQFCPPPGCTLGIGYVPQGLAMYRASLGIEFGDAYSTETFVHEVGHNHERPHAPCGVYGDPDLETSFPYPDASIGVWGYEDPPAKLFSPQDYFDMMSYCSPTWISDYAYRQIHEVVKDVDQPAAQRQLGAVARFDFDVIHVRKGGVTFGEPLLGAERPSGKPEAGIAYDETGAAIAQIEVYRILLSNGRAEDWLVPTRQAGWAAVGLPGGAPIPYP